MKIQFEQFKCAGCGQPAQRRKGRSNPKQFCDEKKCQKIKSLGRDRPVGFDGINNSMSVTRADQQYHGGYSE